MEVLKRFDGLMGPTEKHALPEIFMMEMLEVNGQLFALEHGDDPAALLQLHGRIAQWMERLAAEAAPELDAFATGTATGAQLLLLKECYVKLKYLLRIQERISTFATRDKA